MSEPRKISPLAVQVHIRVRGRVQGVGYRANLQEQARLRGVHGWVRNCPDGTVEAVLQGDQDAVESVVEWAWRGPRSASVHDVERHSELLAEPVAGFEIRY